MSMADDHTLRSYRSNDPYRRGTRRRSQTRSEGGDPLAELARLIGQSDPFAEFGRGNSRQDAAQRRTARRRHSAAQTIGNYAPGVASSDLGD